ncbi:hypothetical protein ACFJIY_24070 [Pimelobacter simplex]|uniref:hypothetical protein n=1 Tax=Nocardioides simplex TaxID=2045 RepID=UPI0036733F4A
MPSPHLRVTERCLEEDLGAAEDEVGSLLQRDARSFTDLHDAVEKFVGMREDDPEKGEPVHGIRPRGKVCSLHVGTGRAVTTWDEEEDVCWLLAYHWFHRNGHPDDCYNIFLDLHNNGDRLLPSASDYATFFDSSDEDEEHESSALTLDLIEELELVSAELLCEARSNPSVEAVRTFRVNGRQIMLVDLVVDSGGSAEEGWMSLRLPEDEHLSDSDLYEMLAALLPEDVHPIFTNKFQDRDSMPGEIVYRWEQWPS